MYISNMEPDVKRSMAQPPPPLDVDNTKSNSTGTTNSSGRNASAVSPSAPSTVHEGLRHPQDEKDVELAQARSMTESLPPPPVKVPRAKRRGLFARFTILAEVEEPKHYPRGTKWFITFIVALAAIAAPLGSTIILRERYPYKHTAA